MRFFIFMIILLITLSSFIFGFGTTISEIFGEYPFLATVMIILIIAYMFISRNPKNYGNKNTVY